MTLLANSLSHCQDDSTRKDGRVRPGTCRSASMLSISSTINLRTWTSFLSTVHRNSYRSINLLHNTRERRVNTGMQTSRSSREDLIRRKQDHRERVRAARQAQGEVVDTGLVRLSKQLSYVLRHGAKKEGLSMRADGYARVQDLVCSL